MDKEQWQQLYNTLRTIYSEYGVAYSNYRNGKNKSIRDKAERDVDRLIKKTEFHIEKSEEAYLLLTGEHGDSYSRTINYNEFIQCWHFERDLGDFLNSIEKKIGSFDK